MSNSNSEKELKISDFIHNGWIMMLGIELMTKDWFIEMFPENPELQDTLMLIKDFTQKAVKKI